MAGVELLSDQGFRIDGRRPGELRRVQCKMGVFSQADGSSYLEQVLLLVHRYVCSSILINGMSLLSLFAPVCGCIVR